jgi:hypothetical protein
MIARGHRLATWQLRVWLAFGALGIMGVSLMKSFESWQSWAMFAAPLVVTGLAGGMLYTVGLRLNRQLAESLGIDEIRHLLRIAGRESPLQFGIGLHGLISLCLPRLASRDQLSETEWKIVGTLAARGIGSAAKALQRAQVWEASTWTHTVEDQDQAMFASNSKIVRELTSLTVDQRAALPAFAPAIPDAWDADDFILAARQPLSIRSWFGAGAIFFFACLVLSFATGSASVAPLIYGQFLFLFRFWKAPSRSSAVATCPPLPGTLRHLLTAVRHAQGRPRERILIRALAAAIRVSEDFSGLGLSDYLALLAMIERTEKPSIEAIAQALRNHAPADLLTELQAASVRWLESKQMRAPEYLAAVTDIRVGILSRVGDKPSLPTIQEVP